MLPVAVNVPRRWLRDLPSPRLLDRIRPALGTTSEAEPVRALYVRLPSLDFSRVQSVRRHAERREELALS